MDFKELLKDFLNSELLVYSLYIYLFALLFYTVYSAMNYFKYYSRVQKTIQSVYSRMNEQERARAQLERQQRDIHGSGGKKDLLARVDEELAYSGIKAKFKWITTEIYIIVVLLTTALSGTIVTLILGLWQGLVASAFVFTAFKLTLSLLANYRDKKTETIMLQFMNIVDNFSKTSDDLISIFEKASKYIDEPLSSQIFDAVSEAKNTGDTLTALQELQDRVKNKHFKVLVRNLEISSRFETNYSDIVEDCRSIFHEYIKSEKEKRSIRWNGLAEISAMLVTGFACVYLIGDITEQGNIIYTLINGGIAGLLILGYLLISIVLACYIAVFQILRDTK